MDLSEKIVDLRKKFGISQEELAESLSVASQTVSKWESGEAIPNFDQTKYLAKIFRVSFDYLMEESKDTAKEEVNKKTETIVNRSSYNTNIILDIHQADIDNGYIESRTARLKYRDYVVDNVNQAKISLGALDITDIMHLHKRAAIFFFYDHNNYTCGFFYAGKIQFVCPIENLLGFTYGGGNQRIVNSTTTVRSIGFGSSGVESVGVAKLPSLAAVTDNTAWCSLQYREGNLVKNFDMSFDVCDRFLTEEICKSFESLEEMCRIQMDWLLEELEKLKLKITSLISVSNDIKSGKIKAPAINYNKIEKSNEIFQKHYNSYLKKITEEAVSANRFGLIEVLIAAGCIALLVIIGIRFLFC